TLHRGATILILDEPTAVLTPQESEDLMKTLRQIAAEGRTVIFISHKREEVRGVADRVTVQRGGSVVAGGRAIGSLSTRDLARLMVGDEMPAARQGDQRVPSTRTRLILDDVSALNDRGLAALTRIELEVGVGE